MPKPPHVGCVLMMPKENAVSETLKSPSTRGSARRRLIRGVFGAPAALTLYSGSAFAASSNLRALANLIDNPELSADPGETWVRVPVYESTVYESKKGGKDSKSSKVRVVKATDVMTFGCAQLSFIEGRSSWATVADSRPHTPKHEPRALSGQFVALRFNRDGVIIGVANSSTGGTAVTRSALGSFIGAGCN